MLYLFKNIQWFSKIFCWGTINGFIYIIIGYESLLEENKIIKLIESINIMDITDYEEQDDSDI